MSNPRLQVDIGANTKEFDSAIKNINTKLNDLSKNLMSAGAAFTKAFTLPIVGAAGVAVKAFDTQIKAEARLRAALIANGRQVNALFQDYRTFASELQKITTIGDESTLQMLQVAESMGLTGDSAKRAVKNAIAMSKAFKVNEQSAIRYTAALEQGDATMLTRYIRSLQAVEGEAEKVALAHDILAKAFETATAEAKVGLGPMEQLANDFGDLMEDIGALISNAINPFIERLRELVLRLQALDEPTKALYTGIALITAAIGPALIAFGSFIKLVTFAISPLVFKIAAIVAIIGGISLAIDYAIQNWDALKARIMDWSWWKNTILDMAAFFARYAPGMLGGQGQAAALALESMKTNPEDLGLPSVQSFEEYLSSLSDRLSKMIAGIFDFTGAVEDMQNTAQYVDLSLLPPDLAAPLDEVVEKWSSFENTFGQKLPTLLNNAEDIAGKFTDSFAQGLADVIAYGQSLGDMLEGLARQILREGIYRILMALFTGGTSAAMGAGTSFGSGILSGIGGIFGSLGSPLSMGKLPPMMGSTEVTGRFEIKGSDLVTVLSNANTRTLR